MGVCRHWADSHSMYEFVLDILDKWPDWGVYRLANICEVVLW